MKTSMKLADLIGKTIQEITISDESVILKTTENKRYRFYHSQDCCEFVRVDSVEGDIKNIIDSEILSFDEEIIEDGYFSEYGLYTHYKIVTKNGEVIIKWIGESNGYYSVNVSYEELDH